MTTPPSNPLHQAALAYADLGYPVFPCAPGRKTPLTPHGLQDAVTEPEQIDKWWTEHPDANVAMRTDGLLVVDIDGADNPWLANEPDKRESLAGAVVSFTPRGGRHLIWRQPPGRDYHCSAGKLAPGVDIRANGGYIVVPPSSIEGKTYRWLDPLDISPDKLSLPPAWLLELLDQAPAGVRTTEAGSNAIPEGQRNHTLAHLAGAMRRVGMAAPEILAALHRVNIDRCHPPLPQREVERIANSIARYEPDAVSVALVENHFAQNLATGQVAPFDTVEDLLRQCTMLREPVIWGLLRRGETMNVIAPAKTGKSWLVLGLAMSVATGRRWLGAFDTVRSNVLILDNELHRETIAHRIPHVAATLNVKLTDINQTVCVRSLRGQLCDLFALGPYFQNLEPGRFTLIVLDAFYRFLPRGTDENDNATIGGFYNLIDSWADRLGCSFVIIHHTSKGSQSGKSVTDVGAGAGSQSRATDTHLIMRPHEEPGAVVLEAAVRSWAPVEPIALRWTFPVWTPAPDLDPTALRLDRPRKQKGFLTQITPEEFARLYVSEEPTSMSQVREAAQADGLSWHGARRLLLAAIDVGLVKRLGTTGRAGGQVQLVGGPRHE